MTNTRPLNGIRFENGFILNWGKTSKFAEKGECLINFDYAYSCTVQIKVEPEEEEYMVFDITYTGFKIKRKNKNVKEVKWVAIGW